MHILILICEIGTLSIEFFNFMDPTLILSFTQSLNLPMIGFLITYPFAKYVIDESMTIDQSKHSLFGASKSAADILVYEYGR